MTLLYTDRDNLRWRDSEALIGIVWQFQAEAMVYEITVEGTSAPTSPGATVYKNGSDVTATVMPFGDAHTVSGQVITLKRIASLKDGSDYSVVVTATIAGVVQNRELIIQCPVWYQFPFQDFNYTDRRTLVWQLDRPVIGAVFQFPSETVRYQITVEGSIPPITANAGVAKDGVEIPAPVGDGQPGDVMLSDWYDSFSVAGQVITLKKLFNLKANSNYIVIVRTSILGDTRQGLLFVKGVDPAQT